MAENLTKVIATDSCTFVYCVHLQKLVSYFNGIPFSWNTITNLISIYSTVFYMYNCRMTYLVSMPLFRYTIFYAVIYLSFSIPFSMYPITCLFLCRFLCTQLPVLFLCRLLGFLIQCITILRTGSGYVGQARTRTIAATVLHAVNLISSLENNVFLGWPSSVRTP